MSIDEFLPWAQLANLVVIPLLGFVVWLLRRGLVSDTALAKLLQHRDARLDQHATQIDRLNNRLDTLPSTTDVTDLNTAVAKISTTTDHMQGDIEGLKRSVDRLTAYLMEKDGKG
jgi:outer membrane murein-binding lipoprotein Lpp